MSFFTFFKMVVVDVVVVVAVVQWVCTILLQYLDATRSLDDRILRHFTRWRRSSAMDETVDDGAHDDQALLLPESSAPDDARHRDSGCDGDDSSCAGADSDGTGVGADAALVGTEITFETLSGSAAAAAAGGKMALTEALPKQAPRTQSVASLAATAAASAAAHLFTHAAAAADSDDDAGPAVEDERCRIQSITFTDSTVSIVGIRIVVQHPLVELNLTNCGSVDSTVFEALHAVGGTLKRLCLRHCTAISEFGLSAIPNISELDLQETAINGDGLYCMPQLVERLWLDNTDVDTADLMRLPNLPLLTELQLSGTHLDYSGYHVFERFPNLSTIGVASCPNLLSFEAGDEALPAAAKLFFRKFGTLPKLKWLDLSMLAVDSDSIQILLSRPCLQFLGLVGSGHISEQWAEVSVAAMHLDKPMNNAQILLAAQELLPLRVDVSLYVLRGVFKRLNPRLNEVHDRMPASDPLIASVVECITHFTDEPDLQLVASAALFYLTTNLNSPDAAIVYGSPIRLRVLKAMTAALKRSVDEPGLLLEQLAKNCCLTLRNFHPTKELAEHARELALALLRAALKYDDRTVRLTAIHVCSQNLASLHPSLKEQIGSVGDGGLEEDVLGMVLELVETVRASLLAVESNPEIYPDNQRQQLMAAMEGCWTFLWNVTDETPNNSNRFLDKGGLSSLVLTLRQFTDKALRRNTMGLVTNLAEVPELRSRLMTDNTGAPLGLVEEMAKLLTFDDDSQFDLEVTYNIAGTMCHILAEGKMFWVESGLTLEFRRRVLDDIAIVVQRWTLTPERWINYRSLRPLVDLLNPAFDSEVHLWATWAMLSLCFVNGPKYCEMCYREQGLSSIQTLIDLDVPNEKLQAYCTQIVRFCRLNLGETLAPLYGAMTEEEKNASPPLPVSLHSPPPTANSGGGGGGGGGGGASNTDGDDDDDDDDDE